jgi:hypothetical protein
MYEREEPEWCWGFKGGGRNWRVGVYVRLVLFMLMLRGGSSWRVAAERCSAFLLELVWMRSLESLPKWDLKRPVA